MNEEYAIIDCINNFEDYYNNIDKSFKEDFTDWLINREDSIGYSDCKKCAKQFTCKQKHCTGLVKFSQTKNYGEVKKKCLMEIKLILEK